MLKFFRRIRQSLLAESKFRKYLLYALGEILLVVIGILIALQINNWNLDRRDSQRETEILKELAKNIKYINEQLKRYSSGKERSNSYSDYVIAVLDASIPDLESQANILNLARHNWVYFFFCEDAYESL